jgi:hypothetical protein
MLLFLFLPSLLLEDDDDDCWNISFGNQKYVNVDISMQIYFPFISESRRKLDIELHSNKIPKNLSAMVMIEKLKKRIFPSTSHFFMMI